MILIAYSNALSLYLEPSTATRIFDISNICYNPYDTFILYFKKLSREIINPKYSAELFQNSFGVVIYKDTKYFAIEFFV